VAAARLASSVALFASWPLGLWAWAQSRRRDDGSVCVVKLKGTGAWPAFGARVGVAVEPLVGVATGEALRAVWISPSPCQEGEKEYVMDESSSSLSTLFSCIGSFQIALLVLGSSGLPAVPRQKAVPTARRKLPASTHRTRAT
jgi:hypothetical protein